MATTAQRALLAAAAGIVALLGLAGCAPEDQAPTAAASPEASESPTPTETTAVAEFVAPTTCTGLLGPKLENELLATGDVLFSAPDDSGLYPGTPSNQAGVPFSCWYGRDMIDLSTYEIAAQKLIPENHEGTLAALQSEGFTETAEGDVVTFSRAGDEGTQPAILHELHPDGWITIYSTFGGDDRLATMRLWLDDIRKQLYPAP
jgi:hypothetical protein